MPSSSCNNERFFSGRLTCRPIRPNYRFDLPPARPDASSKQGRMPPKPGTSGRGRGMALAHYRLHHQRFRILSSSEFKALREKGNQGKSRLALHLCLEHNAIILSGKIADMAYAYNKEPIVIFDVPRTQAENLDHLFAFAESLKNGIIFSNKYESQQKIFKPPIVIFLANIPCPDGKWSSDRVIERDLNCPNNHK